MTVAAARLSAIYRYPVKSCRGLSVPETELDDYGVAGDRRWMVVDPKGRFLSQRRFPRMALIGAHERGDGLVLSAPGMGDIEVTPGGTAWQARVWGDDVAVLDCGLKPARWLETVLGVPCRLVTPAPDYRRPVAGEYDPVGREVVFADGFPLLLIGQGSLDELNRRLARPVSMLRFRPNLVVEGIAPHEEDRWRSIRVGAVEFEVVKPCSRCTIPQVDPETAMTGEEPTATLATYRRDAGRRILFGQNLIHRRAGVLRVGDAVEVRA